MSSFFFGFRSKVAVLTLGLFAASLFSGTRAEIFTQGQDIDPFTKLQNGQYAWDPQLSPSGPVLIIVSIPMQRLFVYRNGVRIGKSSVSTGRPGHPTPVGVFTILEKEKHHESTIYKGASMPYMERLTWGGIALHAGYLPGYSDSHGCVRLPYDFAQKLFTVTDKGTTVMITNGNATPVATAHPGYLLVPQGAEAVAKDTDDFEWNPEESPTGPVSIIISLKTQRMFAFRNGVEIGRAVLHGSQDLHTGLLAYTALDGLTPEGLHKWSAINVDGQSGDAPNEHDLKNKLGIPDQFRADVRAIVTPGTTLVISDADVSKTSPVDTGVNVLTTDAPDEGSKH
jgi:hypothetical protein